MCGIHFILDKHSRLDLKPIQAMVASTVNRGPDANGVRKIKSGDAQYFFGANKLSITDNTKHSNQPFSKDDGNSPVLLFNGEIYNYQDLKNGQLKEGVSFKSASDTEVLYNHLVEKGLPGIKELNGMFGLIFFDPTTNKLLVSRDRSGMKPLFYFEDDNYLILSSEAKGVLASGLMDKKLNHAAVKQYLTYRYVRRPATFFEGILEFEPNTFKVYDTEVGIREGLVHENEHRLELDNFNSDDVIQSIDRILSEALLNHIAVTGPTGLFLSGGVDSTLLLAKMHELGIRQVPTYSFVPGNEDRNQGTGDYKYSAMASRQFHSTHFEVPVDRGILGILDDFVSGMDQPVGDSGAIATYLLAKKASEQTRVVFSGAGADELFAGYNRHRGYYHYLKNYQWIKHIKKAGEVTGSMLYSLNWRKGSMIGKYFQSLDRDPAVTWEKMISFHDFAEAPGTFKPSDDLMNEALEDDRLNYLVNDVLAISDRMSMQASIEMRMPYLDLNLVSYVKKIPAEYLIKHGQKHILKKLLQQRGGGVYTHRPKEGLGLPFGGWINKENEGQWEFLGNSNHILFNFTSPEVIFKRIREHRHGIGDHSLMLWSVLVISRWLEANF